MKNPMMEARKQRIRLDAEGQRKGIYVYHCYNEKSPDALTWWDDFSFYLGGIRYTVCFIHPRMKYKDECERQAWDRLYPSYPKNTVTWQPHSVKKLGKSRKKTVTFTMEDSNQADMHAWHQMLWEQEAAFLVDKENKVVASSSVRVEWWKHGKGIDICVPCSITNHAEAEAFVRTVREHYKQGTLYSWVASFNHYQYDANDWIAETDKRRN